MRGMTLEEAKALRGCLVVGPSEAVKGAEEVVLDRLVEQGRMRCVDVPCGTWCGCGVAPDGVEYFHDRWIVTEYGLLALRLRLHEMTEGSAK